MAQTRERSTSSTTYKGSTGSYFDKGSPLTGLVVFRSCYQSDNDSKALTFCTWQVFPESFFSNLHSIFQGISEKHTPVIRVDKHAQPREVSWEDFIPSVDFPMWLSLYAKSLFALVIKWGPSLPNSEADRKSTLLWSSWSADAFTHLQPVVLI